MTTVGVMQPSFLGWVGYFAMIDACDVFVLDDLSQYVAKSWHSRNRIRTRDGHVVWLTVPVHGHRAPLNTIQLVQNGWQQKQWRTLEAAYSHLPGWPIIDRAPMQWAYDHKWTGLTRLTRFLITYLAFHIGITTEIRLASDLGSLRPDMADRIVDMCHAVGADTLLNTPTAQSYLDESMLDGIQIEWFNYHHPIYPQPPHHDFTSHLSILDCLAHCGTNTLATIRSGTYATQCESREQRASKR